MRASTISKPKCDSTWPRISCSGSPKYSSTLAAAQADDVRVLLLQAGFVIMLIAGVMHQVQLVHQAAFLEQFERR